MSLIFWSLTCIVLVKYVLIVLRANDKGEGGTFALYTRLCRSLGIKPTWGGSIPKEDLQCCEESCKVGTNCTSILPCFLGNKPFLNLFTLNSPLPITLQHSPYTVYPLYFFSVRVSPFTTRQYRRGRSRNGDSNGLTGEHFHPKAGGPRSESTPLLATHSCPSLSLPPPW